MWNILRPYLRCICSSQAVRACNGNVIWWDHCVWYVINHLDKFFPIQPTLLAKFMAFMVWVAGPGRLAVQCQLTFNHIRSWMIQGVMQYAKSPEAMILPDMPEMAGPRMIEKHIKPASFSIANPKLPSQGPPTKKQRINLNTPPNSFNQQKNKPAFRRGRRGGHYSGGNNTGGRYASGRPKGPRAYSQQ
jgi:hypothetical protein